MEPVDARLLSGKHGDRPEPKQALDHARVVAQRQHEEGVGEQLLENPHDKYVARERVAEPLASLGGGGVKNECNRMTLRLPNVSVPMLLPGRGNQPRESAVELGLQRAMGEIDRAVLAGVEDRPRGAEVVPDHGRAGAWRPEHEDGPGRHRTRIVGHGRGSARC